MKRSPIGHTTTPERDKITQIKQINGSLLVHIVELSNLSTAVVIVDIKVINASLTQNQCKLQCVTPPLAHVQIPQTRDATELK